MTDQQIEQEIQAKGKTAPRVTPADIEATLPMKPISQQHKGYMKQMVTLAMNHWAY